MGKQYKRRFIEDETEPEIQKLNKESNKLSQKSIKTQKYIIQQLYDMMSLKSRIKFHDKFGGDCLDDVYEMMEM